MEIFAPKSIAANVVLRLRRGSSPLLFCGMETNLRNILTTLAITVLALATSATAAEPTAFGLIKEGNKHVGEDAKDRIVQIRSEKSVGTMTPNIWHIVFYDPDASLKATEVTFSGGVKQSVKRPSRLLEPITGAHKQL